MRVVPVSLPLARGLLGRWVRVNAFLIETEEGTVLVDGGRPGCARLLRAALATLPPLRMILLTHPHYDHVGDLAELRAEFGVPVAAARCPELESGRLSIPLTLGRFTRLRPLAVWLDGRFGRPQSLTVDVALADGAEVLPGITAISLPGHCAPHFGFLLASGDMLVGDALVAPGGRPRLNNFYDSREQLEASAQRIAALATGTVYVCHGQSFPAKLWAKVEALT